MPQEDRQIIFNTDEVYKAIYALSIKKNMKPPPPGQICNILTDENDAKQLHIYIENPQMQDDTKTQTYSRDFMAAALVLFCSGTGIPLPKKAQKSVIIKNQEVILRIVI